MSRGEKIVAIISARNEAHTIAEVVRGALRYTHEVLVMDGQSNDATAALAEAAGARVIQDDGRGKGAAVRQGLRETDADIAVLLDADGSHDPADIPRLVKPLLDGEAELCVGSRFSGGTDELSVTVAQLVRTVGNVAMNIAINKRFDVALTDTLNGYRAVRRTVALEVGLVENRHTIEQEMVMKVLARGYRVCNVGTHEYERRFGVSHIAVWREWPTFVRCVATNIFRRTQVSKHAPLRAVDRMPAATWMRGESSDAPNTSNASDFSKS